MLEMTQWVELTRLSTSNHTHLIQVGFPILRGGSRGGRVASLLKCPRIFERRCGAFVLSNPLKVVQGLPDVLSRLASSSCLPGAVRFGAAKPVQRGPMRHALRDSGSAQ